MKCNRLDGHMDLCSADGRVTPCCLFDTSHGWKSNIYTGAVDEEWEDARNERIRNKRIEWDMYRAQVTEYELEKYLPNL